MSNTSYGLGLITNPLGTLTINSTSLSNFSNISCGAINTNTNTINTGSGSISCGSINCGAISCATIDTNSANIVCGSISSGIITCSEVTLSNNGQIYGSTVSTSNVTAFSQGIYAAGNINLTGFTFITTSDYFDSDDNSRVAYLNNNGSTGTVSAPSNVFTPHASYSLFSKYRMMCGGEMDVASDIRIKKNISDIPSKYALNIIKNIKPKKYMYKDYNKQGTKINYGFIAQEVFEEFPESITKITDYIPNIFCMGEIKNNKTLEFKNFSTENLSKELNNINLKLINNKNIEFIVKVKEIISNDLILLNEELENGNYFVFGQEVDNFHILEKNAIFTLTTSAVKELDSTIEDLKTELQQTHSIVLSQKTQIDTLTSELSELKELVKGLINKP